MGNDTSKINRTRPPSLRSGVSGRALIFGNGKLHKKFLREIRAGDYIIGVDRAAYWLIRRGRVPDVAIGDFDSVSPQEFRLIKKLIKIIRHYPSKKDKTDMELALSYARGETFIFGWSGTRLDHTFATLHMMKHHVLIDENNRIRRIGRGKTMIEKASYRYISILPYTKSITLSLTGFRYNLNRKILTKGSSLGVSNEIVGTQGVIHMFFGKAWVIESND
jgi:thiamine pyrophosphokinase